MKLSNNKINILIIFVIAILSGFFWSRSSFGTDPIDDGAYYSRLASSLLNDGKMAFEVDNAVVEPLYPEFVALTYVLFGNENYDAVRVIQILLTAFAIVFFYLITESLFNKKTALLSCFFMSVFYGFALSAAKFNREILMIFCISLFLLFFVRFFKKERYVYLLLSCLCLGFLSLTNGATLYLYILLSLYVLFFYKKSISKKVVVCFVIIVTVVGLNFVWSLYLKNNYNNDMLASRSGIMLYTRADLIDRMDGNYAGHLVGHLFGYYFTEKIYPTFDVRSFRNLQAVREVEKNLFEQGMSAVEVNNELVRISTSKFISKPHIFVGVSLLDFISLNNPFIPHGEYVSNTRIHLLFAQGTRQDLNNIIKGGIILCIRVIWLFFFTFVVYGFFTGVKKNKTGSLLLLTVIVYFNVVYSLLHAIPRYALPIYPLYIVFFTIGIINLITKIKYYYVKK